MRHTVTKTNNVKSEAALPHGAYIQFQSKNTFPITRAGIVYPMGDTHEYVMKDSKTDELVHITADSFGKGDLSICTAMRGGESIPVKYDYCNSHLSYEVTELQNVDVVEDIKVGDKIIVEDSDGARRYGSVAHVTSEQLLLSIPVRNNQVLYLFSYAAPHSDCGFFTLVGDFYKD